MRMKYLSIAYSVSNNFPIITVTATTIYSSKRIVITISAPPKNRCIQGSVKIIQPIPWTLYLPPSDVFPFVALAECPCPFLTSGYGQRLLVFSSEAPSFLANGALQLSKDIYVVPLPANAPLPNCASLYIQEHVPDEVPSPPPVIPPELEPIYSQTPEPTPTTPKYTNPISHPLKTTPSPKVYTPAPPPKVNTPAPPPPPVYTPTPPSKVNIPSPPTPDYTLSPRSKVYTPAPPSRPVYTPAPPPPPVYTSAPPPLPVYTPAPPVYTPFPPPVYTPKPYQEPIAKVPPPPAFKTCPLPTRTCPICSSVLPHNFTDFYCRSSFALVVAIGLDFKILEREKEDPRNMPFIPAEKPGLSFVYDSSKYAYNVTVIPEKTAKKISHASYGDTCYKEKVRGIQEITKVYEPYEMLTNLEIYVPEECKCETLESPAFGVLLSQTSPPDLYQPMQLSDSFALFPLHQVEMPIPSCNPAVPPYPGTVVSSITYGGALKTHEESFEDCDDSPCEEDCHILPPGLTVPCDAKAAVLIEILETSAGPYVVPTLTISEHTAEYFGSLKSFWLHVRPNDPYREPSTYGNKEPLLKNCKYLKAKVVLDLSPYPSLAKGDIISIIAGPNCNHKLFLQANGYAVLISKVALSPNAEIPLAGNILKCIPSGITILTLCQHNPTVKPPPPPVYNTPLTDPSTPVPYVPPVSKAYVPPTSSPYPPTPAPYVPVLKAYVAPTSPPYQSSPASYVPPTYPPSPSPKIPTSPPSPAPPVAVPNPGDTGCPGVLDNSCPICIDGNALDLAPELYCKAKLALMLKSTGKFTETSPSCIRSDVSSLFDVTTDRGASKVILAVHISLPSRCLQECPALDGEEFVLALFPEGNPLRETSLRFQLTSATHLVLMKSGKLSLPGCKDRVPRSGEGKTSVKLEATPLEWRALTKDQEDLTECPFHSCPVCEPLSDDQLERIICSLNEVYAVSTEEKAIGLKSLSNKKVSLTQSAADDVTAHIEIENYDTCNTGRLTVLETIKTINSDNLTEINYAIPDHCECPYLLSSQKTGYYMYNASSAEQFPDVAYHLTKEYRLVPITDAQAAKRFECENKQENDYNDNEGDDNADTDSDTYPDTELVTFNDFFDSDDDYEKFKRSKDDDYDNQQSDMNSTENYDNTDTDTNSDTYPDTESVIFYDCFDDNDETTLSRYFCA